MYRNNKKHTTTRLANTAAVAVAAVGVSAGAVASAPAAVAQTSHESATGTAGRSCVAYIGEKAPHCFDGSAQQARYETAGAMSSWVVVGYFYSRSHYAGARLTVKAPSGCDADTSSPDWSWSAITPTWNNRVRSYVTRRHCDLKGYDGANYTGEHFRGYSDHDSYMPHWGGRISSFRMS